MRESQFSSFIIFIIALKNDLLRVAKYEPWQDNDGSMFLGTFNR
jgi:hypothetical protein